VREIRSHGSARGVRSNPYPYRDTPPPDAVGGAAFGFPPIPHSNPGPKARTSPLTVPESPHCRVRNREWNTHYLRIIGSGRQTPSLKKRQSGMPLPSRTYAIHG
jgi:hypothetical protein